MKNPNRPSDNPNPLPNGAVRKHLDAKGCPIVEFPKGTWDSPLTMAQVVESALGRPLNGGPLTIIGEAFNLGG